MPSMVTRPVITAWLTQSGCIGAGSWPSHGVGGSVKVLQYRPWVGSVVVVCELSSCTTQLYTTTDHLTSFWRRYCNTVQSSTKAALTPTVSPPSDPCCIASRIV